MIRLLAVLLLAPMSLAAETLRVAVTTSFENSGLAQTLLPALEADTGLTLQLIVVGSGQALRLGQAGDVDAVIVHSPEDEETFVADGHGLARIPFMYNDFVLIGPPDDPAKIAAAPTAEAAFGRMVAAGHPFISRGDQSGTHRAELALWPVGSHFGPWRREAGGGMGATLNIAVGLGAYTLSDRATWLTFGNQQDLVILFEGDPALFNQYSLIAVNPERHPHVKAATTLQLADWLTSDAARDVIDGYRLEGQPLFSWNAQP